MQELKKHLITQFQKKENRKLLVMGEGGKKFVEGEFLYFILEKFNNLINDFNKYKFDSGWKIVEEEVLKHMRDHPNPLPTTEEVDEYIKNKED